MPRQPKQPWILYAPESGTYYTGALFSIEYSDAKTYRDEADAIAAAAGLDVHVQVIHPHVRRSSLDRWTARHGVPA